MSTTSKASSTKASTTKHKSSSTASSTPTVAAATSTKALGTTTTVIIAVVASVVGIVVLLLLYRFVSRRRNRRSANPLPPVQPIAHLREQHLYQFEEAKYNTYSGSPSNSNRGTWYGGEQLAAPSPLPSGSVSDSSLVNKDVDPFLSSAPPSPRFNLGFPRASDQSLGSRARVSFDDSLPHPAPAFHGGSAGSSRSSTPVSGSPSGHPDSAGNYFTPPQHPLAESSSPRHSPRRPRSPTQAGHPIRPRPTSMVSTNSRASRAPGPVRGTPHSPHSNIQIMLPAPLAAELSPYGRDAPRERGSQMPASDSRKSVVDQWAGVAQQREEPSRLPREDRKKKVSKKASAGASSYASDVRLSTASSGHSSTSSNNPSNPFTSQNAPAPQRAQSQVYSSSPLSISREPSSPPSAFRDASPPPLPTLPTVYNRFAEVERGRQMSGTAGTSAPPNTKVSAIEKRRSGSLDRPVFFAPSTPSRSNSRTRA